MKTKEKLNAITAEAIAVSRKLSTLSEEELKQVTGGVSDGGCVPGSWYRLRNEDRIFSEDGKYSVDYYQCKSDCGGGYYVFGIYVVTMNTRDSSSVWWYSGDIVSRKLGLVETYVTPQKPINVD